MALYEELVKSGNFLFKNRSYIPLILVIAAIPVILLLNADFDFYDQYWWQLLCFVISLSGLAIRSFTIAKTHENTSGRNTHEGQIADHLNTEGIYSMTRHPLYLGNYIMWLGLLLYVGHIWFMVVGSVFFWLYYERIMLAEENYLLSKFGDRYEEWAKKTSSFIPCFKSYRKATTPSNWKEVLKREYNGLFFASLSFVFVNLIQNWRYQQEIILNTFWLYIIVCAALLMLTLKILKKRTSILN